MSEDKLADKRLIEIHHWLDSQLSGEHYQLKPASSDASFRRYFRVSTSEKTLILMDAPPEKEDTSSFIAIATFLYKHAIHVPEIIAKNTELGFLLITDFGSKAFLDELNTDSVDSLYRAAIDSLITIQSIEPDSLNVANYDRDLLQQELDLFPSWFLERHLGITPPSFLQTTFGMLINNALEQPQVIVHRDYHSRNLMHTQDNSPGIIDFQDAVIGPITYDLASLLRDCYIAWPEEKLTELIHYYLSNAHDNGLLKEVTTQQFTRWFDLMGLQRHIKVLGIFCRLNYRDNKPNYMNDLPLTLDYVMHVSSKYPELSELNAFINNHIINSDSQ